MCSTSISSKSSCSIPARLRKQRQIVKDKLLTWDRLFSQDLKIYQALQPILIMKAWGLSSPQLSWNRRALQPTWVMKPKGALQPTLIMKAWSSPAHSYHGTGRLSSPHGSWNQMGLSSPHWLWKHGGSPAHSYYGTDGLSSPHLHPPLVM